MEQIECSETSAYKIQTPGNNPEENIQHTEHDESLKSKILLNIIFRRSRKLQKATISSVMSVRLSIGMKNLCVHCTDFR
jgi:hypothetical protein